MILRVAFLAANCFATVNCFKKTVPLFTSSLGLQNLMDGHKHRSSSKGFGMNIQCEKDTRYDTVDGRNPANQFIYHNFLMGFSTIPGGCLGFLPSTVLMTLNMRM